MPRDRFKKKNTLHIKKRLYIACEGKKTEYNYLKKFIDDCNIQTKLVSVEVLQTKKNTPKELINFLKGKREAKSDELWAVFDHDGHPYLGDAFNNAKKNNIHIAFSNIAFEYWILLHFENTCRPFSKSTEIISYLKKCDYFPDYEKGSKTIYDLIKDKTVDAEPRAKRNRQAMKKANKGARIYEINPYTNIDELLASIRKVGQ